MHNIQTGTLEISGLQNVVAKGLYNFLLHLHNFLFQNIK